jgi:hypothetical protein
MTDTTVTVALIPEAAAGLAALQERTSLSRADIVNRAICLYDFIDAEMAAGAEILHRRDGAVSLVEIPLGAGPPEAGAS